MSLRLVPRPAATHGGNGEAAIDLSASLNPLGPHPAALEAARRCELGRYPEPDARALIAAAARRHDLDEATIVPTPGAGFGLWLTALALLGPGDCCVAMAPCFGEYRRGAEIAGAEYSEVGVWPPNREATLGEMATALARRPAMLILANPGNPSGLALAGSELRGLCARHPETWIVIDEAFGSFAPAGTSLLEDGPPPANVLIVRSLTKELALPGLRMGYLVAHPDLAAKLVGLLPAWPLSAPALAAARAGLADPRHAAAGARLAWDSVSRISLALSQIGAAPFASDANYLVAHAPGAGERLRARDISVRDCTSFGLAGHIRVGAPPAAHLAALLQAIGEIRADG
ncbi:MAG: histidinol-phosphate transaminase [Candidatus Dormibacteria bacterium]